MRILNRSLGEPTQLWYTDYYTNNRIFMTTHSFHLRDAMNASDRELTQWLTKLPDPSAKSWGYTPFPLFRALQLENHALFFKWLEWGCSLNAPDPFRNPLARRVECETHTATALFKKFPEVLSLLATYDERSFEQALEHVVKENPEGLNNIDVVKLILKSGVDDVMFSDLAMAAIVHGGFSPNALLKAANGELCPIPDWVNSYTQTWEWRNSDRVGGVTMEERKICDRINQIPADVLKKVDVSAFIDMGMIVAAHDLKQHVIFNDSPESIITHRKNAFSWLQIAQTLSYNLPASQWRYSDQKRFDFTDKQWCDLFDSVFEDILDVRAFDKHKQTVFHFLYQCPALPVDVRIHIARKAWESKPGLLTVSDKRLKKSFMELTEGTTCPVRNAIDGWESSAKLNNILEHQTTKQTIQKIQDEPEEPVRRRRM